MLRRYNLTYILADHDKINYKLIQKYSSCIVDTRNRYKNGNKKIIKL